MTQCAHRTAGVLAQFTSMGVETWRAVGGFDFGSWSSISGIVDSAFSVQMHLWFCSRAFEKYNLVDLKSKKEIPFDR
jgi:hypothetical protein